MAPMVFLQPFGLRNEFFNPGKAWVKKSAVLLLAKNLKCNIAIAGIKKDEIDIFIRLGRAERGH
jgi:hypothetical protein